jgi:hypothetical protein
MPAVEVDEFECSVVTLMQFPVLKKLPLFLLSGILVNITVSVFGVIGSV